MNITNVILFARSTNFRACIDRVLVWRDFSHASRYREQCRHLVLKGLKRLFQLLQ